LFPFVPITFAQAAWRLWHADMRPFADGPPAHALEAAKRTPRFLWVIFDEWDYRLTFPERKPDLRLPEIDRFRSESLYAANAFPPGPETTFSMPAFTIGRMVSGFDPVGPDELRIRLGDTNQVVSWGKQPNVFSEARAAGFRTAVMGWYQPYCRVMNESLDACWWWEMPTLYNSLGRRFTEVAPKQARSLVETTLMSPFGQSLSTQYQGRSYHEMLDRAKQLGAGRDFGLVLLHFPVPHAPHAYDRKNGTFTLANAAIKGYYDSLVLADNTIGELRRAMERAGTWDEATILLTSDHPYRASEALDGKHDPRVPFLLKMAGHREGAVFDAPFNTVLTHDLILAVLRGELATPADVSRWLERHRTIGKSPYV
jgi:arylsulfatase A-like enzyme